MKFASTLTIVQLNIWGSFKEYRIKLFSKKNDYTNNGGHFKIVSIIKKIKCVHIRPYNVKK